MRRAVLINEVVYCSGCGLCYAYCTVGAIKPVERERGSVLKRMIPVLNAESV